MADHPIPFSAPMVRALMHEIERPGTGKTQTRRALRMPDAAFDAVFNDNGVWSIGDALTGAREHKLPVRHRAGDRLYVREHWRADIAYDDRPPRDLSDRVALWYEADGATVGGGVRGRFRQARHMPRRFSRLTLIVSEVRVERLQKISEEDAIAEGIEDVTREVAAGDPSLRFWKRYRDGGWNGYVDTAVGSYASLWTEINGPGSWDANPWVAAYSFRPLLGNIDQIGGA